MNEFISPPPQDIPESCIGCPMLDLAATLYVRSVKSHEEFILQRASEDKERDQESLASFFNEAVDGTKRTADEAYTKTMEDLARIAAITELMPDAHDMTVPQFLRIYRTDENRLGDESIGKIFTMLQEIHPEDESLSYSLSIDKAMEMAASGVKGLKEHTEHNLLLSQEFIDSEIALTDTEQQYRKALEGKAEAHYSEQVKKLVENCDTGLVEKTVGIRKKRIASYCGSQAYKK